jgi:hypothetical protein
VVVASLEERKKERERERERESKKSRDEATAVEARSRGGVPSFAGPLGLLHLHGSGVSHRVSLAD